jgi:hypothetical protein
LEGARVRGSVLREQYDDIKRRIDALNVEQKSVCFNHIKSTYGPVNEGYALAGSGDRERILKEVRDVSRQLWSAGNRSQALALGLIMLNIESQFEPGDDAAFVKLATDTLINEGTA